MKRVLDRVVTGFGEAAVDPTLWSRALDTLSEATGSFGAALIPVTKPRPDFPQSKCLDEVSDTYIRDGWITRDQRYRGIPIMKARGIATELDFISQDEMLRHPYWMEWLGRFGLRWFAGVAIDLGGDCRILSVQRTISQGPMQPEQTDILLRLMPHLAAAVSVAKSLGSARLESAAAAFEVSNRAVLFLDSRGHVIKCNDSARGMLGRDLQIVHGKLTSYDHNATANLDRALKGLTHNPVIEGCGLVKLPRLEGRHILAFISSTSRAIFDVFGDCRFIITLSAPVTHLDIDESALCHLFNLAPAEAKLVSKLAAGNSLLQSARALGISYEGSRTRLKGIFSKLDVHRQSELLLLVGSVIASLRSR